MKYALSLLFLLTVSSVHAQPSHSLILDGDLARQLTAASLKEDVAENDKRVLQSRAWFDKVVKATGEDEKAVAAQCQRTAMYILDLTRVRATPVEVLEALALHAKTAGSMQDAALAYVNARRAAPDKSHAAALAALATRK
ncbi:MAG: hypothetical protein Q8O34_14185 [Rhodocyclaceae bacterium]|nr:hypothetical protein [Rhodocyclaceae bacterium]